MIVIQEVSQDWGVKQLGDITLSIRTGATPPSKIERYYNGDVAWFRPEDIGSSVFLSTSSRTITQQAIQENKARIFDTGTLLITCIGNIGRVGITTKEKSSANQQITGIVVDDSVCLTKYTYWWFRFIQPRLHASAPGGIIKILNQANLATVPIPIPYPDDPARSLAEQRRIVARLEAALGEVREMRALQSQIEADVGRLMDAAIQDIFDQPNPTWKTALLTEVAFIQTGTAKGRHFGARKTVELPYLRVANVQAGYLDLDEVKTITIAEDEIKRYRLQAGDLLLTEGGDHDKLGRGAVWQGQIDLCIHQNHIFAVRFDPTVILPRFVEYEMQSWHAKSYFLGVAKKTTNLATINKTKLGDFPLRYPALAEQQAIVDRFDVVRAEIAELQKAQREDVTSVEQLEQSVLAQAFRGEG